MKITVTSKKTGRTYEVLREYVQDGKYVCHRVFLGGKFLVVTGPTWAERKDLIEDTIVVADRQADFYGL